jgi:hypothetical protein
MSFAQAGAQNTARPAPTERWRRRGAVTPDDRMRRTLQSIATSHPMPISRDRVAAYAASAAAFGASGKERVPDRDGKLYDAADPEHHWYEYETPIGESSKQLVEAALQSLLRHAAPGQSSISGSGEPVEATTPFGSLGFIDQVVDPASRSVTNQTQKNHRLYPGGVRRSIIVKDGKVWVRTVGEGNGQLPLVNRLFAPLVWESVDGLIWEDVMRAKEHAAFRRLYPELLDRHGGPGFAPYAPSLLRDR